MPKRKSTDLVQIQTTPIPPLHQSTEQMTACALFYIEAVIKKRRKAGGIESLRGKQVHKVGSDYNSWCAHKSVSMDLDAFDRFAKGAGPTASKILAGMRDSYQVDFEHLLATEVEMSLDENFRPTNVPSVLEGVALDTGEAPHYQGILDTLFFFRSAGKAQSDDMKTHPRPYEPSDPEKALQGKMYSLFIFQHFPWVMEVKFRLVFVRFKNLVREVVYTREEVPSLIETVKAARERQKMIHHNFEHSVEMEATPGDHCMYCPLLSDRSCPIGQLNENMQLTPEDWARWDIWNTQFSKVNKKRMKAWVDANKVNIVVRDYNGKAYSYGPVPSEAKIYPLFQATAESIACRCISCGTVFDHIPVDGRCTQCASGVVRPIMPIVDKLEEYAEGNPGDTQWFGKLSISSSELNSKLGTNKRAFLDQSVQDSADHVTKVKMKMSKPLDTAEEEEPDDDWGEEEDF